MTRVEAYLFLDDLKRFLDTQGKYIDKTLVKSKITEFENKHFSKEKYIQKDLFK
jgi:hypothetical protein